MWRLFCALGLIGCGGGWVPASRVSLGGGVGCFRQDHGGSWREGTKCAPVGPRHVSVWGGGSGEPGFHGFEDKVWSAGRSGARGISVVPLGRIVRRRASCGWQCSSVAVRRPGAGLRRCGVREGFPRGLPGLPRIPSVIARPTPPGRLPWLFQTGRRRCWRRPVAVAVGVLY